MKKIVILAAIAAASPAIAGHHEENPHANGHSKMLMAGLLGTNEVTGGDEDGRGQFMAWPNADSQLCYRLMVSNVDAPTAAHIHSGAAGVNGGVAVGLSAPTDGKVEGCVAVDADTMAALWAEPASFYVNVHNAEHPAGAVRGQLMSH